MSSKSSSRRKSNVAAQAAENSAAVKTIKAVRFMAIHPLSVADRITAAATLNHSPGFAKGY
jgi:hypothetical protein